MLAVPLDGLALVDLADQAYELQIAICLLELELLLDDRGYVFGFLNLIITHNKNLSVLNLLHYAGLDVIVFAFETILDHFLII